jgi:hypothetical protein
MLTANADNTARERLTNTYFEGATAGNPKAGRGRSKEKRSD